MTQQERLHSVAVWLSVSDEFKYPQWEPEPTQRKMCTNSGLIFQESLSVSSERLSLTLAEIGGPPPELDASL